jgi:FG-GAP repeat
MIPRRWGSERRYFLLGWGLFFGLSGGFPLFSANEEGKLIEKSLSIQHVLLAQLGPEHIASATYRRGFRGDSLVAWGERILEWSLRERPEMREVVPAQSGQVYANGGCVLDVNDDGVEEVILARGKAPAQSHSGLFWFQSKPNQTPWREHQVASLNPGEWAAPHDLQPFTFRRSTGKMGKGVVAILARQQLVWFSLPPDPTITWERHEIATLPVSNQSGMALGNLAGHGRRDVVCGMFWVECPTDPTRDRWIVRRFGNWDDNGWGGMVQLALGDLDGDGKLDIVAAEAEIPEARLGFFRRDAAHPEGMWALQLIDTGLYCPHSLAVADVDGDGRLDVIVGEMTAGGWDFPRNPRPRLLAYLNRGGGQFDRLTLAVGLGVHELGLAPQRFDGRLMLYGADEIQPHKFPEMQTHVSYWLLGPSSGGNKESPSPGARQ